MNIQEYTIHESANVLEALEKLNTNPSYTLFVVDSKGKAIGSLTDGDIRRGFIQGLTLDSPVTSFCHQPFRFLCKDKQSPQYIQKLKKQNIHLLPFLSEEGNITHVVDLQHIQNLLPLDAVFMAGGRGERLRPLTDSVPKPLLPLGGKPIIAYNMERIRQYGISKLHLAIRYLGEQIKEYFGNGEAYGLDISYIEETTPLGTIGAASLVPGFTHEHVLVMNSDLFTNIDLEEFYFHSVENDSDISVATIPYNVSVPYAVMQTNGNRISDFQEKPTYTYMANAGIYLIKKSILESLPKNTRIDATELLQQMLAQGKKITYFPIIGYWIDIGKPEDYKKAQEFVSYLNKI